MGTRWMKLGMIAASWTMAAGAACRQQPTNEVRKAIEWKPFEYACAGGAKVTVYLREGTAKVRYEDKQYLMKQTISADGNRYSDGKVVWWSKGNGGFLQADKQEGNGELLVRDCQLVEPEREDPGVVSGTVTYLQRVALSGNAVIEVRLQDVSRAGAPATVIAEQKIRAGGKQVPIPFELKFDPAKIDAKHRYVVSARITVDGALQFVSDQSYPAVTQGNPTNLEILLKALAAKK
jgi:putative lipoprotein